MVEGPRLSPGNSRLVLTLTRECQLRCAYCPTAKSGGPALSVGQVEQALRLFVDDFGGGTVKLFGGEPLINGPAVEAALDLVRDEPRVRHVQVSTNGLLLTPAWLERLRDHPRAVLALSLDGRPGDHGRHRVGGYDHVVSLLPDILRTPRVVVTQTVAPDLAHRAASNFRHLLDLGFTRVNLLPAYMVVWTGQQVRALHEAFAEIHDVIVDRWATGRRLYLRNLATWSPTPFFNSGLVVDSDGSVHASNMGLAASLDDLRGATRVGTLGAPPTPEQVEARCRDLPRLLQGALPKRISESMTAVDTELSRLCRRLMPLWLARHQGDP